MTQRLALLDFAHLDIIFELKIIPIFKIFYKLMIFKLVLFSDVADYRLQDPDFEKQFGCTITKTLQKPDRHKLFEVKWLTLTFLKNLLFPKWAFIKNVAKHCFLLSIDFALNYEQLDENGVNNGIMRQPVAARSPRTISYIIFVEIFLL